MNFFFRSTLFSASYFDKKKQQIRHQLFFNIYDDDDYHYCWKNKNRITVKNIVDKNFQKKERIRNQQNQNHHPIRHNNNGIIKGSYSQFEW